MKLPFDYSRCHGIIQIKSGRTVQCNERESCARFTCRETDADRTPWMGPVPLKHDDTCEFKIENEPNE